MRSIDIAARDLETLRAILGAHLPEYEIRAFGSRVTGTARPASDLDLAIMTVEPLAASRIADLREAFTESDLPFRVDLIDWAATTAAFRAIIERAWAPVRDAGRP